MYIYVSMCRCACVCVEHLKRGIHSVICDLNTDNPLSHTNLQAHDARLDKEVASMEAHTQAMRASLSILEKEKQLEEQGFANPEALALLQLQNEKYKLSDDVAVLRRRIEWSAAMSKAAADTNASLQVQLNEARLELSARSSRDVQAAEDFEKAAAATLVLEEQVEALRGELLCKNSVEVKAQQEEEAALLTHGALEGENARLKEQVHSLQSDMQNAIRVHEEQIAALDPATSLARLRAKHSKDLEQLRSRVSSLQTALASAEADCESATALHSSAEKSSRLAQQSSQQLSRDVDAAGKALLEAQAEASAAQAKLRVSAQNVSELRARAEKAEAQAAINKANAAGTVAEMEALRVQAEAAETEAAELATALDEQGVAHADTEAFLKAQLQEALAALDELNAKAKAESHNYKDRNDRQTADKAVLTAAILDAERRAAVAEEKAVAAETARSKTQSVVLQAGQALAAAEERAHRAEATTARVSEREAEAVQLEKQVAEREIELHQESALLVKQLQDALEGRAVAEKEVGTLASERDALIASAARNNAADSAIRDRLREFAEREESMNDALKKLEAENVRLQEEAQLLKEQCSEAQARLQQVQRQHSDALVAAEAAQAAWESRHEVILREHRSLAEAREMEALRLQHEAEERIAAWGQKHSGLHDSHEAAKQEHDAAVSRLTQAAEVLTRELEAAQFAHQTALAEVREMRFKNEGLSSDLAESDKNLQQQMQLVLQASAREAELEQKVHAVQQKCAQLQEENEAAMRAQVLVGERFCEEAERKQVALEEKLAAQTSARQQAEDSTGSFKVRYSDLLQNFHSLEENVAVLQGELSTVTTVAQTLTDKLDNEVRQHQQLKDVHMALQKDMITLNASVNRAKEEHGSEVVRLHSESRAAAVREAESAQSSLDQALERRDSEHLDALSELKVQLTSAKKEAKASELQRKDHEAVVQRLETELKTSLAAQVQSKKALASKTDQLVAHATQIQGLQEQLTATKAALQSQTEQQLSAAQEEATSQIAQLHEQIAVEQAEAAAANARVVEWSDYNAATVAEYEAALTTKDEEHIMITSGLQIKLVAAQEAVAAMAKNHSKGVTQTRTEHEASVEQLAKQLATQTDQHEDQTFRIEELQKQLSALQVETTAANARVTEWSLYNTATVAEYEAALAVKQEEADGNHLQWQTAYDTAAADHATALEVLVAEHASTITSLRRVAEEQQLELARQLRKEHKLAKSDPDYSAVKELQAECDKLAISESECKQLLCQVQKELEEARGFADEQDRKLNVQK